MWLLEHLQKVFLATLDSFQIINPSVLTFRGRPTKSSCGSLWRVKWVADTTHSCVLLLKPGNGQPAHLSSEMYIFLLSFVERLIGTFPSSHFWHVKAARVWIMGPFYWASICNTRALAHLNAAGPWFMLLSTPVFTLKWDVKMVAVKKRPIITTFSWSLWKRITSERVILSKIMGGE